MINISLIDGHIDNAEHCVCCGAVIPEGRQVCIICGLKTNYKQSTSDVVEVRHGKWIIKNDEKDWRDKDYYRLDIKCSICGKSHFLGTTKYRNEYDEEKLKELGNIGDYSYCGKCGAKMDGKDGE